MDLEGDRGRTLMALINARAWKDTAYRKRLVEEPRAVLAEEGITIPAGVEVVILEDTETVKHVAISRDFRTNPSVHDRIIAFMDRMTPIPEDHEIRLRQSGDTKRYLVLQTPPAGVQPQEMTDAELMRISAGGSEAVSTSTTEATVAETTEASVTETTEAQDTETTTTVVAEAELVAS
jgi:hypothetical protein